MTPRKRLRKVQYTQKIVPGADKEADRARAAKDVGWRTSASGRRYFENRSNRSDTEKEQKYHGGVNRRAKPRKTAKQTSTRASRGLKTTRRVAPVRKRDPQKKYLRIITTTQENDNYTGLRRGELKYYPQKKKKELSWSELERLIINEMRTIDRMPVEYSAGIDKYGNILFRGIGNEGEATIPIGESGWKWWLEHQNDRVIIIHNHPAHTKHIPKLHWFGVPSPLSAGDVLCATVYPGCGGIFACCEGRYYACLTVPGVRKRSRSTIKKTFRDHGDAADKETNEDFPQFEGQKTGESKEDYDKRWYVYMHKRLLKYATIVCHKQQKYLIPARGYRYITKRY